MNTTGRKVIRYALDRLVGHVWIVRADGSAITCGYSRRDRRQFPIVSGTKWPARNSRTGGEQIEFSRRDFANEIRKCRRRGYACIKCSPA